MSRGGLRSCGLVAIVLVGGCSETDYNGPGTREISASVQATSPAVIVAAPSAEAAAGLVTEMVRQISPAPAPLVLGAAAQETGPSCPPTFDLGNGITGTCSVSEDGVVTLDFGGTLTIDGVAYAVDGSMLAGPLGAQPPNGSLYGASLEASATGPRGSATWQAQGTVQRNDVNEVVNFALEIALTLGLPGGATAVATAGVTPTRLDVVFMRPSGRAIAYSFDRGTRSGSVTVAGTVVAFVTLADGCLNVDFVDPALTDASICF